MSVLLLAFVYFAAVFTAGFALGTVRVLFIEPLLGSGAAEIVEMPVMLGWCWLVARWSTRRFGAALDGSLRLAAGALALAFMLSVEMTAVLALRGETFDGWLAGRDPVPLGAYFLSLLIFACLPWWVGRLRR